MKATTKRSLASGALLLVLPLLAHASASLSINDPGSGAPTVLVSGFDATSFNGQLNVDSYDLHGEYLSTTLIPNGTSIVVNIDLLEPAGGDIPAGQISDTLNMVFTGHAPSPGDNNNVSIDLHFRSDTGVSLGGLTNAINFYETGQFQNLSSYVVAAGGPSDFSVQALSGAPEPGSFGLLVLGSAGVAAGLWRKRKIAK